MEAKDFGRCSESASGEHLPDPFSIFVSSDGGDLYLDVICTTCRKTGCIAGPIIISKLLEDICW